MSASGHNFVMRTMLGLLVVAGSACSEAPTAVAPDVVVSLVSVQPANGAVGIDIGSSVVVTFDHAVGTGMEAYLHLCQGEVGGVDFPGSWTRSGNGTVLTFTPHQPFSEGSTYFIHMGGGMMDGSGGRVDLERHGLALGGQWATGSMMGAMGMAGQHMGQGWRHNNGSYGMFFSFSTVG